DERREDGEPVRGQHRLGQEKPRDDHLAAHSAAIGARPDRSEFPAQAGVPVLIVGASDDQVVPTEEQRRWAAANGAEAGGSRNARASYTEIPETGHMLPVEAPDALARAIVDWLPTIQG
ncbi:alpha/beta hydrolase, partial [Dietzia sp. E1]|uniref:alpha/beta fold hydrolase n=1 Tax=Dietzia sp. E1 TaxID=328361 RepID=UPI001F50EFD6